MRDVKAITGEDFSLDIDIVDGEPVYLSEEAQTYDQRASLVVMTAKGTVPGMPDYGINWAGVTIKQVTSVELYNQMQQQLEGYAAADENCKHTYSAQLIADTSGVGVVIYKEN
jgi:hypothetical protein